MQTSYSDRMTEAFPGMLYGGAGGSDRISDTGIQAESSLEIPFGVCVCKGSTDSAVKLPAASDAVLLGVLQHKYSYAKEELGTVGVKPGSTVNYVSRGRVYVKVETNVTKGDRAYVRYASGAGGTQLGAFRNAAVASETIDLTRQAKFLTSASAGGVAVLWVDFLNGGTDAT